MIKSEGFNCAEHAIKVSSLSTDDAKFRSVLREKKSLLNAAVKKIRSIAPEICPVLLMFSESAQLIVWKEKKKLFPTLSSVCWCLFPSLCLMRTVSRRQNSITAGYQAVNLLFFCSRSADLRFCLFFCTGVGRTTALQTGSSSPGCHGSWKLLRGVCRNPTGRSCALVYLCIGDGLGEMKAAKVGKSHPPLWLGNIWCVLTHKRNDSVQTDFTRRPTHSFFHPPSAAD